MASFLSNHKSYPYIIFNPRFLHRLITSWSFRSLFSGYRNINLVKKKKQFREKRKEIFWKNPTKIYNTLCVLCQQKKISSKDYITRPMVSILNGKSDYMYSEIGKAKVDSSGNF